MKAQFQAKDGVISIWHIASKNLEAMKEKHPDLLVIQ